MVLHLIKSLRLVPFQLSPSSPVPVCILKGQVPCSLLLLSQFFTIIFVEMLSKSFIAFIFLVASISSSVNAGVVPLDARGEVIRSDGQLSANAARGNVDVVQNVNREPVRTDPLYSLLSYLHMQET